MQIQLNSDVSITLNRKKPLSKRQEYILKWYSINDSYSIMPYLYSFRGRKFNVSRSTEPLKVHNRVDRLAERGTNYFYKMARKIYDPFNTKEPNSIKLGDALGIEIECILPLGNDKDVVRSEIMERRIKNVNIKTDGSIQDFDSDEYYGLEFTIIVDRNDMSNLKQLCELLDDLEAYVNKTCGLHVHLDCRDIYNSNSQIMDRSRRAEANKKAANHRANRLVWALPILTKMLPKSRLDNDRYCRYGKSKRSNRYYMVNTVSLNAHQTIEIRAHSGTTSYEKISQWAKLLYAISRVEAKALRKLPSISDATSLITALEVLSKRTNLDVDVKDYMLRRIKQFNPQLFTIQAPEVTDLETSEVENKDSPASVGRTLLVTDYYNNITRIQIPEVEWNMIPSPIETDEIPF